MKGLIEIILKSFWDFREIPEELLFEFSQKTMQIIQKKAIDEIPDEFSVFENYVEMFWRGKKYNHMSNRFIIYQMGQLLTCTNMLNRLLAEEKREASIEAFADLFKDRAMIFEGMYKERGITHKKLAELSDMSVSALSQFISKNKSEGFFTYRVMGREKHYYLTEYGEKLYFHMLHNGDQKKMKYVKMYGFIDDMNEKIINNRYYKVVFDQNANEITESVYISTEGNSGKKTERLMKMSINKAGLESNKEEKRWDMKDEMLRVLSKIS